MSVVDKIKRKIRLSRELLEKYLFNLDISLSKEHFFQLVISKFILMKEKLVKKSNINKNEKVLYFDNIRNRKYILVIYLIYDYIKNEVDIGNASYTKNNIDVIFRYPQDKNATNKLKEAIWVFNKLRDSFAHPNNYEFDLENDMVIINNVTNDYSLVKYQLTY